MTNTTPARNTDDNPQEYGRTLAQELYPEGLPRGDLQGVVEARFGMLSPKVDEALDAYDEEFARLAVA